MRLVPSLLLAALVVSIEPACSSTPEETATAAGNAGAAGTGEGGAIGGSGHGTGGSSRGGAAGSAGGGGGAGKGGVAGKAGAGGKLASGGGSGGSTNGGAGAGGNASSGAAGIGGEIGGTSDTGGSSGASGSPAAGPCKNVVLLGGMPLAPGGSLPAAVGAGDFDGDGKADLAVVSFGDDTLTVRFGAGDGTFSKSTTYPLATAGISKPLDLLVVDFDLDGRMDVAIVGMMGIAVLYGTGGGALGNAEMLSTDANVIGGAHEMAAGDVDGDHRPDLIVRHQGAIQVFPNASGSFGAPTTYSGMGGQDAAPIAVGDIDGDGRTEIVAFALQQTSVVVLSSSGGSLQPTAYPYDFSIGTPSDVRLVDADGDGELDIVITATSAIQTMPNSGGTFFQDSLVSPISAGFVLGTGDAADLTGDGRADVLVHDLGNGTEDAFDAFLLFAGAGDGTFQLAATFSTFAITQDVPAVDVAIADLNGDGRLDWLVPVSSGATTGGTGAVQPMLSLGGATFTGPTVVRDVGAVTAAWATAAGDVNHDGVPDVVLGTDSGIEVFINDKGAFASAKYPGDGSIGDIAVADLDGDGFGDVVAVPFSSADSTTTLYVFRNKGDGTFGPVEVTHSFAMLPPQGKLAVGDVDGDGHPDVVISLTIGVAVARNDGKGTLGPAQTYGFSHGFGVVLGDFTGDGIVDVAQASYGAISVLPGLGDGKLGVDIAFDVCGAPFGVDVAAADVDRDGQLDVLVSCSSGDLAVLRQAGGTLAVPVVVSGAPQGWGDVVSGDFDRDGWPDVAAYSTPGSVSLFLNDGAGNLSFHAAYSALGGAGGVGDFNGDGALDLVLGNEVGFAIFAGGCLP